MNKLVWLIGVLLFSILMASVVSAKRIYEPQDPPRKLTEEQSLQAEKNYKTYCVLCHGQNREGHANDHAPSLRSNSLFESGVPHSILRPLSYGREGTAMGGYLDEVGGPMTLDEVWDLTYWLFWQSGAERKKLSEDPVKGNATLGETAYQTHCASCHGKNLEGINAPALGNPSFLAHNKDEFIRYAIEHGRQDTPMREFSSVLTEQQIDDVTAFIRSKASHWTQNKAVLKAIPTPDQYVINPDAESPKFELQEGMFVSSKDLYTALQAKKRMILLDTRVTSVWQRAHIEGAIPFPYYSNLESKTLDLPKDVQIVAYCSCPRAAAVHIVDQLRELGYKYTAVLYEGIFGWMNMGYPVTRAEGTMQKLAVKTDH